MKTTTHIQLFRTKARRSHSPSSSLAAFVSAPDLGCWPLLAAADCVDRRKAAAREMVFYSRAMAAPEFTGEPANKAASSVNLLHVLLGR